MTSKFSWQAFLVYDEGHITHQISQPSYRFSSFIHIRLIKTHTLKFWVNANPKEQQLQRSMSITCTEPKNTPLNSISQNWGNRALPFHNGTRTKPEWHIQGASQHGANLVRPHGEGATLEVRMCSCGCWGRSCWCRILQFRLCGFYRGGILQICPWDTYKFPRGRPSRWPREHRRQNWCLGGM